MLGTHPLPPACSVDGSEDVAARARTNGDDIVARRVGDKNSSLSGAFVHVQSTRTVAAELVCTAGGHVFVVSSYVCTSACMLCVPICVAPR